MHLSRSVLTLAVFGCLTTVAAAAPLKGTRTIPVARPHHHHHIEGVVVSVRHGNAAGHGEIKVKVHHHHHHKKTARTAAAAATTKKPHHHGIVTIRVHNVTKFVKVEKGQGGKSVHLRAQFGDVHQGEHVHIAFTGKNHEAKHVAIIHHHKGKKSPSTPKRQTPLIKGKKPK